jgi:uncharacterized protein YbcI
MPDEAQPSVSNEGLAEISAGLSQIHSSNNGQDPIKATSYCEDGLVFCKLEGGGLTALEKTLIDRGRGTSVPQIRRKTQQVLSGNCKEVVEAITRRKVTAHLSTVSSENDLAFEIFLFH